VPRFTVQLFALVLRLLLIAVRVNVGGKLLTNYLKELVPINMVEETYVMNIVKEKLCYVSQDFLADLAITKTYGLRSLGSLFFLVV
jgi:hypothetical protein